MTIRSAIKLVDVELTSPLVALDDLHEFRAVRCLLRFQGVPVADAQPTLRIPRLVVGGTTSSGSES